MQSKEIVRTAQYLSLVGICAEAVDSMRQWSRSPSALKAINNRIGAYEKVAADVFNILPEQFSADIYRRLGRQYGKAVSV